MGTTRASASRFIVNAWSGRRRRSISTNHSEADASSRCAGTILTTSPCRRSSRSWVHPSSLRWRRQSRLFIPRTSGTNNGGIRSKCGAERPNGRRRGLRGESQREPTQNRRRRPTTSSTRCSRPMSSGRLGRRQLRSRGGAPRAERGGRVEPARTSMPQAPARPSTRCLVAKEDRDLGLGGRHRQVCRYESFARPRVALPESHASL